VFAPTRDEVAGTWRRLHNEELYELSGSTNIDWVINKNEMDGHAARMGTTELHKGFWYGDIMEKDHFEDLGVEGRKTLKFIFKKWDGEA
jgi:hypothetical protein